MAWDDTKVANDDFLSSDWNDMVTDQKTRGINSENKRGSDCSGTDGTTGRILTLANTSTTKTTGMKVFRNGALIHPADYTLTNNSSSSTIAFTTIIWDADYIYVEYFT